MVYWFSLVFQLLLVLRIAVGLSISKPNCVDQCGGVMIPYPFGITADCYHNRSYEIICNTSSGSSKPFLRQFNLEVIDISWPGGDRLRDKQYDLYGMSDQFLIVGLPRKNLCESSGIKKNISYDLRGSPYQFLTRDLALMMEGCESRATLKSGDGFILASCASVCVGDGFNMTGMTGNGDGYCTASNPDNEFRFDDFLEIDVVFEQQTNSNSCNASVTIVDPMYNNITGSLSSLATFPTALLWDYKISKFSPQSCDVRSLVEYDGCDCPPYHEGNPYLPNNGCQVVHECQNCKTHCDLTYSSNGDAVNYHCRSLFRRASFLV